MSWWNVGDTETEISSCGSLTRKEEVELAKCRREIVHSITRSACDERQKKEIISPLGQLQAHSSEVNRGRSETTKLTILSFANTSFHAQIVHGPVENGCFCFS
ncbi:uncharacterized protein [Periplaneta americana]|uniref:uncharacterized protein n=1 Tax=Periplaneta americana TaxID=6978 RepID=UPI0037E70489